MYKYHFDKSGSVINLKTQRKLKQHKDRYGYMRVTLWVDGVAKQKQVHRLIAIENIPNPQGKPEVNHIDGDKTNNCYFNLEWVTRQENRDHAVRLGLHKHQKYNVSKNGVDLGDFISCYNIAFIFNLDPSSISKVANGHYKTTKGYKIKKI